MSAPTASVTAPVCARTIDIIARQLLDRAHASPAGLGFLSGPIAGVTQANALRFAAEQVSAFLKDAATTLAPLPSATRDSNELRGTNTILAAMRSWNWRGHTLHKLMARSLGENGAEQGMEVLAYLVARQIGYDGTPIDMLLFCPRCNAQHIDAPEPDSSDWDNPPHRSHQCHACGHIWRPSDAATNGVASIKTTGGKDGSATPGQASAPLPSPGPAVITPVFMVCDAYESGIGHGLRCDEAVSPFSHGSPQHEAYQIGYDEGVRRAALVSVAPVKEEKPVEFVYDDEIPF